MKHVADLVKEFHSKFPKAPRPPNIRSLQAQQDLKEGMLSRTVTPELWKHVTVGRSHDQTGSDPSRDPPRDQSRDPAPNPASQQSCDKEREHDLIHALSSLAPAPVERTTGGMGKSWEPAPRSDYRFCQYVSPSVAHDSGPCDCMSSPSPFGPFY